jgi:FKBP-type peptidyl-prolyl cis-trans isomerase FkpA
MKKILLAAVVFLSVSGCMKDPKCEYNECGVVAPAAEIQSVQSYLQSNNIIATQHCSGIFYAVQQEGTGTRATPCGSVSLYYKGMLTNGNVFDQTQPGTPAGFSLSGGLITGFKNAMLQMKSGGKMTFYIPPSLGYGASQTGSIPANSILIFEVELLAAQ